MQTEPLKITRVDSISNLAPYLDDWQELAADRPMQSPEWLLTWWEIYAASFDELCILIIQNQNGALVGLAPLYLEDAKRKARFRLIGAADSCTHHFTWLSVTGCETGVGIGVAQFLLQHKSIWKRLLFEAVDDDAVAIRATMTHLKENGCLYHQRQIHSVWKITLPKTWDDYLMMLSRSHRKQCRKLYRQFLNSEKVEVCEVNNEAELDKGFKILLQLHRARWGNPKKPYGVFGDRRFLKFHQTISRKLLARKQLRLVWLAYEGKPLAVEYQFFDSEAVYAYQAGVDLAMDEFSPGRLSMMVAIQFAISRGCRFFDLLRGNEPYKTNWRAEPVACYDLRAWQQKDSGTMEWLAWQTHSLAVRHIKPIIPDKLINWGLNLFKRQ